MPHTLSMLIGAAPIAALVLLAAAPQPMSARQAASPREIEVVATRYAFTPSTIEVVEGEMVRLMVRSGDGLHGIEIKPLKVKEELPRGAPPVAIAFTAPAPGEYPILCSEYCGDGHADMKGMLIVTARPSAARTRGTP